MSDSERREVDIPQHLDLEHEEEREVSRDVTDRVFQKESNANSYVKLAVGIAFLPISFVLGFGIWFLIPAAILIALGLRDLGHQKNPVLPAVENNSEKELLSSIRDNGGSITPAEAAIETSLTVREADEMLSELANDGHLQIEGRDGVLYYSLPGRRTELES